MMNCILVACYFESMVDGPPIVNLVHINGVSISMRHAEPHPFNLETHLFDYQPIEAHRPFTFKEILAVIPDYTLNRIDIIGGNETTDDGLISEVLYWVEQYRPGIHRTHTSITQNGHFEVTITPTGHTDYVLYDLNTQKITLAVDNTN